MNTATITAALIDTIALPDGSRIDLWSDLNPDLDNPRTIDGNIGVFVGFPHPRYTIGDEQIATNMWFPCPTCTPEHPHSATTATCRACDGRREIQAFDDTSFCDLYGRTVDATHIFPVGMLDHTGRAFYLGGGSHHDDRAGWDSGTCGLIYTTRAILDGTGRSFTDDEIRTELTTELDCYEAWVNGYGVGYTHTDADGHIVEERDGFYSVNDARAQAEAAQCIMT